ncbi:MAG: ribonuclease D [Actinobacteria bacterium]|nr:ribonuclease D [Actinomycetota bacterium]
MKLDSPRLPVTLVTDSVALSQLIAALSNIEQVSLDAERASGFRYSQRAYLVQIATDREIFLIDPIALSTEDQSWPETLRAELGKKTWLLHAATQDLPCLAELGLLPKKLIDTELAARIAGMSRVGLGSLCEELLGLELAKEHSASDWSIRPLTDEMLNYAALDVDVMAELWKALEKLIEEQGKLDWIEQEFDALLSFKPKPQATEPWRNLPGLSKVKDLSRVKIAASLWLERDGIARASDVAPGRLIPDRSIMAVVNTPPRSKSDLAANKEFQGRASRSMLTNWWAAIERAEELDIELKAQERGNGIPNHRSWEKRFPEAHRRLETVRPKLVDLSAELSLPVENLLTPDYLRRVCFAPEENIGEQLRTLGARDWQIKLVEPLIQVGIAESQEA